MAETKAAPARAAWIFALLTALLTAALYHEIRQNRVLRDALARMAELMARERGLEEGRALAAIELRDGAGAPVPVTFEHSVGTVLLFHSGGCDACANTAPRWRSALAEAARPDLQIIVAQTDGESTRIDLEGLPASLIVPLPPVGWHGNLPAVPATLVVDANGVLVRAWYGELDEASRKALVATLGQLGS